MFILFREPQSKWFAKRGLSWHIGVVTFKDTAEDCEQNDDSYETITFVHVFDSAAQDAAVSSAILTNILDNIQAIRPDISKVYVRSDNAGCYHSSYAICSVPLINRRNKTIKV